jgi:hypothetical protein
MQAKSLQAQRTGEERGLLRAAGAVRAEVQPLSGLSYGFESIDAVNRTAGSQTLNKDLMASPS